jgi:hypothetical protein
MEYEFYVTDGWPRRDLQPFPSVSRLGRRGSRHLNESLCRCVGTRTGEGEWVPVPPPTSFVRRDGKEVCLLGDSAELKLTTDFGSFPGGADDRVTLYNAGTESVDGPPVGRM